MVDLTSENMFPTNPLHQTTSAKATKKKRVKGPVRKAKDRIQKLLLLIARDRDGTCVLEPYQEEINFHCGGVTTADHVLAAGNQRMFADPDCVVLLCLAHHFSWKSINPFVYTDVIRKIIGEKRYNKLMSYAYDQTKYKIDDWLRIEEELKQVVNSLGINK